LRLKGKRVFFRRGKDLSERKSGEKKSAVGTPRVVEKNHQKWGEKGGTLLAGVTKKGSCGQGKWMVEGKIWD